MIEAGSLFLVKSQDVWSVALGDKFRMVNIPKGTVDIVIDVHKGMLDGHVIELARWGTVNVFPYQLGTNVEFIKSEKLDERIEKLGGLALLREFVKLLNEQ